MMSDNPALRAMVAAARGKYCSEPVVGIIPFEPADVEARDVMIVRVADMISNAVTGPAICASELAERIVDEVLGIDAEWDS